MTGQWTAEQSTWPAHLRDNAPSQQCGRCGRHTYSPSEFGAACGMPQPDGYPCCGRFEPPGILLDLYAAPSGAPTPTDTTTPLHDDYTRIGKGWVRLVYPEPQEMGDLTLRIATGNPHLLIKWQERNWRRPDPDMWAPVEVNTLIGHGTMPDGRAVRMVAYRAGRTEDEVRLGKFNTTVDLYRTEHSGEVVTWYHANTLPNIVGAWHWQAT